MGSGRKKDVTRLLKRGLNEYGLGELASAIGHWEEALALDPGNRAARDYLETAYEETTESPDEGAPAPFGFLSVAACKKTLAGVFSTLTVPES